MHLRNFSRDDLPVVFNEIRRFYGNGDIGETLAGAFLGLVERIGQLEARVAALEAERRK